ncbi:hypothetical protein [Subtercola sp. RTI3]|uniref:hypothetical protein n=1 Tax=Subtercola sp. RTI3 TaxID=3048639 RepID=UPI002B22BC2D|nr:hypothetical protein [Subtercola sp. RTI3]MEA9984941.1 hypothetical protein [Subtercola sp. RTI3]
MSSQESTGRFVEEVVPLVREHLASLVRADEWSEIAIEATDPVTQASGNELYVLKALRDLAEIRDVCDKAIRGIVLESMERFPSAPSARQLAEAAKLATSTVTRWQKTSV